MPRWEHGGVEFWKLSFHWFNDTSKQCQCYSTVTLSDHGSGLLWYYHGDVPPMMNIIRGKSERAWLHLSSPLKTWRWIISGFHAIPEKESLIAFFKLSAILFPSLLYHLLDPFLCSCASLSLFFFFTLQCMWWRTGEETTQETHAWQPAGQLCVAAVSGTCWHNYSPTVHPHYPLAPYFCASGPNHPPPLPQICLKPCTPLKPPPPFPLQVFSLVYK